GIVSFLPVPVGIKQGAPPVQVSFHLRGHRPEVNRYTVDYSVRFQYLFVDFRHIVFNDAKTGFVALLAVFATGDFLFVQDNFFHFRSRLFGASQSIIKENIAVTANSWTSHNAQYFHVTLLTNSYYIKRHRLIL